MSTVTLVISDPVSRELTSTLAEPHETAGVLLVGTACSPHGELRLLTRELHLIPQNAYRLRDPDQLVIASDGYVPALARAEQTGATPLWFHTHSGPRATPAPSVRDHKVDEQIADLFRLRSGSERYGTLILSGHPDRPVYTGHIDYAESTLSIGRMWQVGPRLRLTRAYDQPAVGYRDSDLFDRNVRAFGGPLQDTLSALTVGIVGTGGTGSAVAEQLARLGVGTLVLVDPDTLSRSNLTRVYGSTPEDVGEPKAHVLARHLARISPAVQVRSVADTITNEPVARELIGCDIVFGCTDDNAGRLVLSRLSTYLLTPVIDLGVLLSSDSDGTLIGIDGRVTVLTPGGACLVCRDRIDLRRAQAELMPPDERGRLQREGYAAALPGVEPAVVTFTTIVAAAATSELIERLAGYGPEQEPGELLLRLHEREISTNTQLPRPDHYCDPASGKTGLGDTTPFLEQTWAG